MRNAICWALALAAFAVLYAKLPWWIDGARLHLLTAEQQSGILSSDRNDVLKMVGGAGALVALVYTARKLVLERQAHALNLQTFAQSEQGQVDDRFDKAVAQLDSDKLSEQLRGIYALEQVMADVERHHATVVLLLAAFVRRHAPLEARSDGSLDAAIGQSANFSSALKQAPDHVQAAMTVLARRPHRSESFMLDLRRTALICLELPDGAYLVGVNFVGTDLTEANLNRADLTKANLTDANLTNASLQDTTLAKARLNGAEMTNANLKHAAMLGANLGNVNLAKACLEGADLSLTHLSGADLTRANLAGANLARANLAGVNLTRAILGGACLTAAHLSNANLTEARLRGADLTSANLGGANLTAAHLSGANLTLARLRGADLTSANLEGAYLTGAHLSDAKLHKAQLRNAELTKANLYGADLTEAHVGEANFAQAHLGHADLTRTVGLKALQLSGSIVTADTKLDEALAKDAWVVARVKVCLDFRHTGIVPPPTTDPVATLERHTAAIRPLRRS